MAVAHRRTTLINPGRKRKRRNARRRLTRAQIAAGFGGKRRQAAIKHRHKASRRPSHVNPPRKRRRKAHAKRRRSTRRRNVAEIIVAAVPGNPARKKRTRKRRANTMARARRAKAGRRRRRSSSHTHRRRSTRSNPVIHRRRRRRSTRVNRRRRRSNPAGVGRVSGLLGSGLYVVGGAVGTRMITQAVLGAKNTGVLGYGGNVVSAFVLSWGVRKFLRNPHAANMVLVGGFSALAIRLLQDYTPLGKFVNANLAGMGIRGDTGMGLLLNNSYADPAIYNDSGAVMPAGWLAAARAGMPSAAVRGLGMSTYRASTYA